MNVAAQVKTKNGVMKFGVIDFVVNEQEYLINKIEIQKRCAHMLVDYMLKIGVIKFNSCYEVCLCGCEKDNHYIDCPNHPQSSRPVRYAVRATVGVQLTE